MDLKQQIEEAADAVESGSRARARVSGTLAMMRDGEFAENASKCLMLLLALERGEIDTHGEVEIDPHMFKSAITALSAFVMDEIERRSASNKACTCEVCRRMADGN